MSNELSISKLIPEFTDKSIVEDKIKNSTFIGIDFGTSTTVVSYAIIGDNQTPIKSDKIPIKQLNVLGNYGYSHLVPSCIAVKDDQIYIGEGAKQLKSRLIPGRNLWFSFKMGLGKDMGPEYLNTVLKEGNPLGKIENPLDAAKVFFKYLKQEIDDFVRKNSLPTKLYYSVSIPASFESNQRADLMEALEDAGIAINSSLFIDEPNAAFLSYLVQANSNELKNYTIPLETPLHVLVFDFGAGTCDISILEIGRQSNRLYSKNIAISKFEQLGGDDIDRIIAKEILLPQLAKQNSIDISEIKESDYKKRILPVLQAIAEQLKISVSKKIASNLVGRELPSITNSTTRIALNNVSTTISIPKQKLIFEKPSISPKEFTNIMNKFTSEMLEFNFEDDVQSLKSIFTVINSALQKANIEKNMIDLVLLIGGSSYNPYIQNALYRSFGNNSDVAIPQDLQSHVSNGTAINSFIINGLGVDIIKPIVSEPIFLIMQGDERKLIVSEGTEMPCMNIIIDDLHPQKNGKEIEIPICVSNKDKILTNLKVYNENGFQVNDKITLNCSISHDKLIQFKVFVSGIEVSSEPLNPFVNTALTTSEIAEKQLIKEINKRAKKNGGSPTIEDMLVLAEFYDKVDNHLKAAETYETVQQINPSRRYETHICYHYSNAGRRKLSDKWAKIAYEKDSDSASAFNLALVMYREGKLEEYVKLMEEAISYGSFAAMSDLGKFLLNSDEKRGTELIKRAFDHWYKQFKLNDLIENDYHRLINAARLLKEYDIADKLEVSNNLNNSNELKWYNTENTVSDSKMSIDSKNINFLEM